MVGVVMVSSGDWTSLSTDELCKILPIADKEQDVATVQIIMKVLADRHPNVKRALIEWARDPSDDRLVQVVIQDAIPSGG
ncbi:hypothetical protein [Streptomyces nigrescens]|uniref:hypothetical protein n=1 Tax=Streptomyces nigrescens TaxID=1920 RepID=UPI0036FBD593